MNNHADDMSQRDRESGERHHRDQYPPPTGTPHHSNAGSLPIHQPVASRVPGAIHSPGGLLANHGGSAPSVPIGAPSGPVNSFAGSVSGEANRPHQHNAQNASSQMFGAISGHNPGAAAPTAGPGPVFGGPLQQEGNRPNQTMPFTSGGPGAGAGAGTAPAAVVAAVAGGGPLPANSSALPKGQQPILNVSHFDASWVFQSGDPAFGLLHETPSFHKAIQCYSPCAPFCYTSIFCCNMLSSATFVSCLCAA